MSTIIENFVPQGGKHCVTNALKQVFAYYGYPLSEEMLFGLASGLAFLYLNQVAAPIVSGRTKVFDLEQKLAARLNITIQCKAGKNPSRILDAARKMLDARRPVLAYVDMPYLSYLELDPDSHFGGHAVVLFGYDDSARQFWVSDRDNHDYPIRLPSGQSARDYHLVDYGEMGEARGSVHQPFPAGNKYLTFDFAGFREIGPPVLREAIRETCAAMLNPPARLLGINGIRKLSEEILKWEQFPLEKLRRAGTVNYFQISRDGGTGGGIFRRMYGEFLMEAASIMEDAGVSAIGEDFVRVSERWDDIAAGMWRLSQQGESGLLKNLSETIGEIYGMEKGLYASLAVRMEN